MTPSSWSSKTTPPTKTGEGYRASSSASTNLAGFGRDGANQIQVLEGIANNATLFVGKLTSVAITLGPTGDGTAPRR